MKSIDEYKKEILLKIMSGEGLAWDYIGTLPKEDPLRTFMCELGPKYAYYYALDVDRSPHDETRKATCEDPEYAYWYASAVDKGPHEETRKATCRDPYYAYRYSYHVDKSPHEETRKSVCRDPECAYRYAYAVDKGPHEDTRRAAYTYSIYKQKYIEHFGE
jgi:hypothetical protein